MFASHYVINHIYIIFEKGDLEGTKELFEKFTHRYSGDDELIALYARFIKASEQENKEELSEIKKDLKTLLNSRKFKETSGGISPTAGLKSRRPGIDSWVKLV
ncbi:MAG: hypothetical protein U9M95_01815 [Candidatus Altiarchaeota archaeon]|nr:hypothetical protein [Candidatus Altiarchaeota archaeon]